MKYPPLKRQWFRCPHCHKKLFLCDDTAEVKGIYIKCKNCKNTIQVRIPEKSQA